MSKLSCRMYERKYPDVDDVVMVNVRQITDLGAYVRLLEYDNIEGMILLAELSRRRIRSVQKLIRVGRNEVVVVLRVDKEKGYIDLSKRRVSPEEIAKCEERFNKSKAVHSIMRHVAEKMDMDLELLYTQVAWPLYKKYGHAYDAFKIAISNPDSVLEGIEMEAPVKEELVVNIQRRLTPQPVKIRADVELSCFGYEGVNAVKDAMRAAESVSTDEIPIKVKLIAAPLYVLLTTALDKQQGITGLENAITQMETVMQEKKGHVLVKMKPKAVSETDDKELADLMARVEKENMEVSGDDDAESDE